MFFSLSLSLCNKCEMLVSQYKLQEALRCTLRAKTYFFTTHFFFVCVFRVVPRRCVSEADLAAELPLMWNAGENVL